MVVRLRRRARRTAAAAAGICALTVRNTVVPTNITATAAAKGAVGTGCAVVAAIGIIGGLCRYF